LSPGNGYPQFRDRDPATDKTTIRKAHRVMAEIAMGRRLKPTEQLNHDPKICSCNPRCVRPDHLYIGTQTQNMADAVAMGRLTGRKLNPKKARQIVGMRKAGKGVCAIADLFGINVTTVRNVLSGKAWGDATGIGRTPKKHGSSKRAAARVNRRPSEHHQGAVL
jgi:hypothetical protein